MLKEKSHFNLNTKSVWGAGEEIKMAKSAHKSVFLVSLVLVLVLVLYLVEFSVQLQQQPSEHEALWKIKQQLNFPPELSSWSESSDFCYNEPNPSFTLVCYEDNVTQLHIAGNSIFPQLAQDFSTFSFFSILLGLPNLKVLSLVSLGLRGPLPAVIGNLSSLEILNVSSNYFDGTIPKEISNLKNLQTLILDHNMFSGWVPEWVGSLSDLSVLSLRNNSLSGSLPSSLSGLKAVRALVLSSNLLSGEVPSLQNLTNLQVVDLEDNKFGPHLPSLPIKLVSLVLRRNNFSVIDSHKFMSCYLLQKLDVSWNSFIGPFSLSLLSLPSLNYLDISGNKFTGKLLKNTSCNGGLRYVNLSSNRLTGELPSCLRRRIIVVYYGNCLSKRYPQQHPYSYCHNEALAVRVLPKKVERKKNGKAVVASSMIGGIVAGMALLGLALVFVRREYGKQKQKKLDKVPHTRLIVEKISPALTLKMLKDASYISETRKLGPLGLPPYRTFVLDELKEATHNFGASNLIGEGSNGQVYKGWLTDGNPVAIRSLKVRRRHGIQSYTPQLELIAKLRHVNLVSAIGHCFECYQDDSSVSKIHLVFEYVPNGNLRDHISEGHVGERFSWAQRIAAVIEVARGIQFLHTGIVPGIFANHLKITDVLLDADFHVKISKYNLSLLAEDNRLDNVGAGAKHRLSNDRTDIYDLGVILLETIVGRKMISENDINVSKEILVENLAADDVSRRSIVDPAVYRECSDAALRTVMELCVKCISDAPSHGTSIEDVIWNMQFAAQVQESWRRDASSNQGSPGHLC